MKLEWDSITLPPDTIKLTTIEAHAAGEPLRIVTGGLPELPGATMLERRRFMRDHYDYVRQALMWEPRGHYNMYGCIITPPVSTEADLGVLFMHNEGYSTMCGHGVIALVTVLVESGAVKAMSGTAFITGRSEFVVDPRDPLGKGFLIEEIGK